MVLTPLHYVHAYAIHKISRRKLSLPGLVIGSAIPDIETPILFLIGLYPPFNRLVLHSLIGSLALSWIIGLILLPLYRMFIEKILSKKFKHEHSTVNYAFSVLLSSEIHLITDSLHHPYNPLFWPITSESIDALILLGDWILASMIMQVIFKLSLLTIIIFELKKRNLKIKCIENIKELIFILLVKN